MAWQKIKKSFTSLFTLSFVIVALSACTKKTEQAKTSNELRVLTWSEYFDDEVVKGFEEKNGVKVIRDYFASNEELLAKLKTNIESGSSGYDLILPSDYMVATMIELGLLRKLDKDQLLVLQNLDPKFQSPTYDPKLEYSVPFSWGTTGIAVNYALAPELKGKQDISWKDLLENPKYKGRVTMLSDVKENFQVALLMAGKDWETATEDDIKKAFEYLKKTKKNLKVYTEDTRQALESNECALCQAYSGDVLKVNREKGAASGKETVGYVYPKEGGTLWADNFALPKNAVNVELAYKFINHMLNVDGAKKFTATNFYPTTNLVVRDLLEPSLKDNRNVYPGDNEFRRLKFIKDRPDLMGLVDRLWTELRAM
jgi:spermidine/putrescine transport system substrate-binding protein